MDCYFYNNIHPYWKYVVDSSLYYTLEREKIMMCFHTVTGTRGISVCTCQVAAL